MHELPELLGGRAGRDGPLVAQRGLHLAGAELADPDGYLVRLWDERSMKEK